MVQDVGVPIINLRLYGTDASGTLERGIILEYELPINFSFEPNLSSTFSALQIYQGEFLGFLFAHEGDKQAWNSELRGLSQRLSLTSQQIEEIKIAAKNKMDDEFSS